MLVSRIWVVVVALAAVGGLAIARLVPNPAARELARAYAENLDRGQHNAELILRLEARDWIDAVAKIAWDGTVIDLLEQASNRRGDPKSHQARLSNRLLTLLGLARAEARPQLVIAVDHRGKQIARIGPGEDRFRPGEDGLAGYPLVEAALRGYRADDTWSLDGKLLLMAASPVISRSRGRYVGALLVGLDVNDAFARRLKSRLAGTDLCFFLRGKVVGCSARAPGLERLPGQFEKRAAEIGKHGRSAVIRLGEGNAGRTAILAALPGEAAEHGAFYAAVGAPVPAVGLGEMLGMAGSADLGWSQFPWPLLLGSLIMAVAVGLALLHWEHDAPLRRLLRSAEKLGSGEATRLDEYGPGNFGRLARALNDSIEKLLRRGAAPRESKPAPVPGPPLDVDRAIAGSGGSLESAGVQPLGSISGTFDSLAGPAHVLGPVGAALGERRRDELPSHRQRVALSLGTGSAEPAADLPALELPGADPLEVPGLDLKVTASRPSSTALSAVPSSPGGVAASFDLEPGLATSRASTRTDTATGLRAVRLPPSEEAALGGPPPFPPEAGAGGRQVKSLAAGLEMPEVDGGFGTPETTPRVPMNPEQEYYRQVFDDFLAVKRQCGENIANLTFERFVEKLRKNRDSLMKSYGCQSVKFQVYIKDGKAALKATPIKD